MTLKTLHLPYFFVFFAFISGCSSLMQKMALDSTADLMSEASKEIETEGNFAMIKRALPANIKMIEGLAFVDPENEKLNWQLVKAYAGYAFMVNETQHLENVYKENDQQKHLEQALMNYSKAIKYGLRYLANKGVTYSEMLNFYREPKEFYRYLDEKLDADSLLDREVVFFLGQSWGGMINLQRSNLMLMSQLPLVKGLFDWTCDKDPDQQLGSCAIFYGSYAAGRPKALGGEPSLGKKYFLDAMVRHPSNLMIPLAYIQFYLIPLMEEKKYLGLKSNIEKRIEQHKALFKFNPKVRSENREHNPLVNLHNTVAAKRYEIIKKYEKEIF